METESRYRIIRRAFVRLAVTSMFVVMATNICSFVDNIAVSRMLGTKELAAMGLFSPVAMAAGFSYVLIVGSQVLCANFIGAGKKENVNKLFYSSFAVLGVVFLIFSAVCFFARGWLAGILGAKGLTRTYLSDYMAGYVPCIMPQALCALLMSLVSFNNDMKRSYYSTAVMIIVNAAGDVLLAMPLGIMGIGLASTISYLAAFAVLLPGFVKKDKALHLKRCRIDFGLILKAAVRGLPSLMFAIGLIIKNYLMNYTLNNWTGDDGVAVMSVLASVCAIAGAFPAGFSSAYMSLAGLYYGEEDRSSLKTVMKIALKAGLIVCVVLVGIIMAASSPLSSLFFKRGESIWDMGRVMFLLGFLFLPLNLIFNLLLKSYQVQGRMRLVNILSTAETAFIGVLALIAVPGSGVEAAWLTNTWVDIICIAVVLISVFIWRGRVDLSIPSLQKLPDDFGAAPEECLECSIRSVEDAVAASEAVLAFCKEKGIDARTASYAGLCVEEMAGNVLQHGFTKGTGSYSADVRVVCKDGLTIRIRDNCREFDPRKRLELFTPEAPEKNIGIRLVAGLARTMDYYNTAGVNTLLIKL